MAEPSSAEAVVRDFIPESISAWSSGDAITLAPFFSEDAEYRNGPLPPVRGEDLIVTSLTEMMASEAKWMLIWSTWWSTVR